MRKKFSLVYSLLLGTIATTTLAGCGSSVVEKKFSMSLQFDHTQGSVSVDKSSGTIDSNTNVTVTITPNDGFEINIVKINNTEVVAKNTITFSPKEGTNNVFVSFKPVTITPTVDKFNVKIEHDNTQGSVLCDVLEGEIGKVDKVNLTITPNEGFEIEQVTHNNSVLAVNENKASFVPVKGENLIKVTFKASIVETDFNVVAEYDNAQGNVTIDNPNGTLETIDKVNVAVLSNEGFEIESITVNGETQEVTTSFSFAPIEGENLIKVTFKVVQTETKFNVGVEFDPEQGEVTVDINEGIVEETEKITVTIKAKEGFVINNISINDEPIDKISETVAFKPIGGENKVKVLFALKEVENDFTVIIDPVDETQGTVVADIIEGIAANTDLVTITATPNEDYLVESISVNGDSLTIKDNKAKFKPVTGENKVVVVFKAKPIDNSFTVKVVKTGDGSDYLTVRLDKVEGKAGETVNFTLTYSVAAFEIVDILVNEKSIQKETRSFIAIKGENVLEIKIQKKVVTPTIDKGSDFEDVIRNESTDLHSSQEAIEIIFNKIEEVIEKKGATEHARKLIGAYARQFNLYDNVFKKYGITKADIDTFYNVIATDSFIAILNSDLKDQALSDALTKEFYRVVSDLFKGDYSMDKFVGFISTAIFVTVSMTYGQDYGYRLIQYYDYIEDNSQAGKFARNNISSSKPSNDELNDLFGTYETIGQLMYLTIKNCTSAQDATELERFFKIFKKIGLGVLSPNEMVDEPVTEDEIFKIIKLLNDLLNNHFLSKEGFMKFVDRIYGFGDVAQLHLKLFAYTDIGENLYVTNTYKQAIDTIYTNKEQTYYLIKFIGLYSKHIEKQDISDFMYVFSKTDRLNALDLAKVLIIASRHIDKVRVAYRQSEKATAAINNMGPLLTKIIVTGRNGTVPETLTSHIDFERIVNKLVEIDGYKLSDANKVTSFAQEIIDSIPNDSSTDNIFNHKITINVSQTCYKINLQTNFVVSATYDGTDITKDLKIDGFSTEKEGYFVAEISYKDYTFFKTYTVTKNGIGMDYENYIIPALKVEQDASEFDKTFTFSDGTIKKFSDFEPSNRSFIDTTTKGLKTGWVNYLGNYYFFTYEVK